MCLIQLSFGVLCFLLGAELLYLVASLVFPGHVFNTLVMWGIVLIAGKEAPVFSGKYSIPQDMFLINISFGALCLLLGAKRLCLVAGVVFPRTCI